MICVECGTKIGKLLKKLPHNEYELSLCKECGQVVDPYIEYEQNLKLLHILLCRPQVYRHFLYNYDFPSIHVFQFVILVLGHSNVLFLYLFSINRNQTLHWIPRVFFMEQFNTIWRTLNNKFCLFLYSHLGDTFGLLLSTLG